VFTLGSPSVALCSRSLCDRLPAWATSTLVPDSGDLVVERRPLSPKILTVSNDQAVVLRRPFKSPCPGASSSGSEELIRRLSGRRRFVPWGGKAWDPPKVGLSCGPVPEAAEEEPKEEPGKAEEKQEEDGIEPLVLWNPEEDPAHDGDVAAHPGGSMLTKFLRPHQRYSPAKYHSCLASVARPAIHGLLGFMTNKISSLSCAQRGYRSCLSVLPGVLRREGVQFMFECVAGLRDFHQTQTTDKLGCYGCILQMTWGEPLLPRLLFSSLPSRRSLGHCISPSRTQNMHDDPAPPVLQAREDPAVHHAALDAAVLGL